MTTRLLKFALIADAVASCVMGGLLVACAGILSGFLALPQPLLLYAGLFLLPYAGCVLWTGTRQVVPSPLAWLIVALNAVWVVDSFAILITGFVSPNVWGIAFVVAQAMAVAALAAAQVLGLVQARSLLKTM
ncbi:integral membrane protein [Asticcacaulis biprosthecium C19]|uniref:Integral membrane protein n=1 Tax=Asticcacaulis biprosthecium C19 TaxID=715226 RepID=F4QHK4_9CAUL|nr:hypothetical protein [Asticcacaulis biprosthecium]EGF92741.1 integral membrane protein [Asticcacaulis biprosthecium C19]